MSYHADQRSSDVFIAAAGHEAARVALLAALPDHLDPDRLAYAALADVLSDLNWEPEIDGDGDIVALWFEGDSWTYAGDRLAPLAPFVRSGSSIEAAGEDGYLWRWWFANGKVIEQAGVVSYPDPQEVIDAK